MDHHAVERLTADLQQLARVTPITSFREQALIRLQEVLPFDSGLWLIASLVDDVVSTVDFSPFNSDSQRLRDYASVAHLDPVPALVAAAPLGTCVRYSIDDLPDDNSQQVFRQFLTKHGNENLLGSGWPEPVSHIYQGIAIFRRGQGNYFTESDGHFLEAVLPSLMSSFRYNRQLALRQALATPGADQGVASCDGHGVLNEADANFIDLLQGEWPCWQGARLPVELMARIRTGMEWCYRGQQTLIRGKPVADGRVLIVATNPGETRHLSDREYDVARRYAIGATYRQIATALYLSPATVRNHLAAVYRKLGVSNKKELRGVIDPTKD